MPSDEAMKVWQIDDEALVAIARKAMAQIDVARTGVTNPVNGSAPYSWVMFAGGVMHFHDGEFSYPRTAGTEKAAEQAQRINDLLLDLAKRAASQAATEIDKALAKRDAEIARLRRQSTDRLYMMEALVQMLGPKGLEVWKLWQSKGVLRVHHDWGPTSLAMSGEERAQVLLDWEAAPKTPVEDID